MKLKILLFFIIISNCLFSQENNSYRKQLDSLSSGIKFNQLNGVIYNSQDYFIQVKDVLERIQPKEVIIKVHTSSEGKEERNLEVSKKVANKVKLILQNLGFDRKIIAKGIGETHPKIFTPTRVGRYKNRRIEIEPIK